MNQCSTCQSYLDVGVKTCPECKTPVSSTSSQSKQPQQQQQKGGKNQPKQDEFAMPDKKFTNAKLGQDKNLQLEQQEQQADLIVRGLAKYYLEFIRPLEQQSRFDTFASPSLNKVDFFAAPQVLLCGQYSVGKTSFINYVVEKQVIGAEIGDQPTTSVVQAVMCPPIGQPEGVILGNAAASDINLPFGHLQRFGINFLNRFQVSYCNSPILDKLTFIDTPGILAGEKQRVNRDYNFADVTRQLGANASMILVLFDAHKLDISDEMRDVLVSLRGYEDKLFIVLNKADGLSSQSLLRVYGSLMWSLARVFSAPEALRVFIGSFWSQPYRSTENKELLQLEEAALLTQLRSLPKAHSIRLVNEIVKRARQVKTHVLIVNQLRSNFGIFSNKEKKKKELLQEERLIEEFKKVQVEYNIPMGDFPKMSRFVETITQLDIHKLPETSKSQIQKLDWVLQEGIPTLMRQSQEIKFKQHQLEEEQLRQEKAAKLASQQAATNEGVQQGYGGYSNAPMNQKQQRDDDDAFNPFADDDTGREVLHPWSIPDSVKLKYTEQFNTLKTVSGKLSGQSAKPLLSASGLTGAQLKKIWSLSDIDHDGYLDCDEFILCCYLIDETKKNGTVPTVTLELCPPSKREIWSSQ